MLRYLVGNQGVTVMRIVGRHILQGFLRQHADARRPVGAWLAEAEAATWRDPVDVKTRYPSASFLADNQVIFNIKGNKYRLKVMVAYATQTVIIQQAGTHAEYNRW